MQSLGKGGYQIAVKIHSVKNTTFAQDKYCLTNVIKTMAKSKGFYGLRKGSTKSMTYSVLRGQQITKDRVEGGANPKTYPQMIQRMIFGNAVKFYKHAKAGFFKFAYEDKKTIESDYNAFMRKNALNAVAVTYPNYKEDAYPAFGRYILTEGSLPQASFHWIEDNTCVLLPLTGGVGASTVNDLSSMLLSTYPSLQPGDIVTIVLVHTSLNTDGSLENLATNRWDIRQFVIDTNDTTPLLENYGIEMGDDDSVAKILNIDGDDLSTSYAKGACVIFSRNTPNGLKVSNGYLKPNGVAAKFIEQFSQDGIINQCASTWGATDPAILAGGIANQR